MGNDPHGQGKETKQNKLRVCLDWERWFKGEWSDEFDGMKRGLWCCLD